MFMDITVMPSICLFVYDENKMKNGDLYYGNNLIIEFGIRK